MLDVLAAKWRPSETAASVRTRLSGTLLKHPTWLAFWSVLGILSLRVWYFSRATDSVLVTILPDDVFYYIQIAKHRVSDGIWSFDGLSATSGFHILYAYLLYLICWVDPNIDWRSLFVVVASFASLSMACSAFLVSRTAERVWGRPAALLAVLPFFSRVTLSQCTTLMESWLVMLCAAFTMYVVTLPTAPSLGSCLVLVATGLLGSLARSDYGLFPAILLLTACTLLWRTRDGRYAILRTAWVLVGAVAGVAFGMLHVYATTHHILQASAQTKLHWSALAGHSVVGPLQLVGRAGVPGFSALSQWVGLVSLVTIFFVVSAAAWRARDWVHKPRAFWCFLATLLTLFGYVVFYRHNSQALQDWYAANLVVPMGIILAAGGAYVPARISTLFATTAFLGALAIGVASLRWVQWPPQVGMLRAGIFLRNYQPNATYGAWNAGIISYFSSAKVINLDGLTNDEIAPAIAQNKVFDYVARKNIDYLVDYAVMIERPSYRLRGGYSDARVDRCWVPLQAVDADATPWQKSHVWLYRVVPNCR